MKMRTRVPSRQHLAMNSASCQRSRMHPWEAGLPSSATADLLTVASDFWLQGREWNSTPL